MLKILRKQNFSKPIIRICPISNRLSGKFLFSRQTTMTKGYSSGMRDHRVQIMNKVADSEKGFGETTKYECVAIVWASFNFSKGTKSLREGALDAYDTVMFRMLWNPHVTRDSQLVCNGKTYQIQSLNGDKHLNQIQITATEVIK